MVFLKKYVNADFFRKYFFLKNNLENYSTLLIGNPGCLQLQKIERESNKN